MENTKNSAILAQNPTNPTNSPSIPSNFVAFPSFSLEFYNILTAIKTQMAMNPGFLDLPNCPYATESKQLLRQIFGTTAVDQATLDAQLDEFFGDKEIYHRIISDTKRAYMNLAKQMTLMETGKNLEDTIAYTKALTGQQERLLTIQEKAEGLKNIHEFKIAVLDVIATELTPDQRTGIMNRLEERTKA